MWSFDAIDLNLKGIPQTTAENVWKQVAWLCKTEGAYIIDEGVKDVQGSVEWIEIPNVRWGASTDAGVRRKSKTSSCTLSICCPVAHMKKNGSRDHSHRTMGKTCHFFNWFTLVHMGGFWSQSYCTKTTVWVLILNAGLVNINESYLPIHTGSQSCMQIICESLMYMECLY